MNYRYLYCDIRYIIVDVIYLNNIFKMCGDKYACVSTLITIVFCTTFTNGELRKLSHKIYNSFNEVLSQCQNIRKFIKYFLIYKNNFSEFKYFFLIY